MESEGQTRADRRRLTHLDRAGRPRMVDVSGKAVTARRRLPRPPSHCRPRRSAS